MTVPKSILMPLSSSGQEKERMLGALSVAAYFSAHLEVLHATLNPRRFIPDEVVARRMPQSLLQELEALASKYSVTESSELQQLFQSLCDQNHAPLTEQLIHDAPTACWQEIVGLRSELVGERGKVHDLIIVPQPKSGTPTSTFEAAIMRSGKPVLLMPRTLTTFCADRVLIAWNGSTESARAVASALPVLKAAKQIVVGCSNRSSAREPGIDKLIQYLARHGVEAIGKHFDSHRLAAGESLLQLSDSIGSDLIVMGAYTHRRVHEQIFGGVTRHMVGHATIPIWMMH
ncbi:universal stress protein [Marinobacter alexandrii]|jgi:nucleotide-binding universal stress UspA family protein|uniref:universal stress protein n=1 Tax=Marinobacter alexandrii TaxID=2570351 RepID=UPI002ABE28A7|nr:universal stress protein [Marinobacter alexandrii]